MLYNPYHAEFSLLPDAAPVEPGDVALLFKGGEVLLRIGTKASRLPLWGDVMDTALAAAPRHAFTQGRRRYFIGNAQADAHAPGGFVWENVRVFRNLSPETDAALLNAARHLITWYDNHRFCGACGGPTLAQDAERALVCQNCGNNVYPSVLPAVIMAVTDRGRLLLARNARGVFRQFSLLAGFVEVGETAEQAVAREVFEEVGLRVKNIRYIKSQPWGISQSLMLGFTAELDGPDTICLQESELAEAHWFERSDVPTHDSTASIAFTIMEMFRQRLL